MNDATDRTLVWDLPTRVFHWTLAAMFVGNGHGAGGLSWALAG